MYTTFANSNRNPSACADTDRQGVFYVDVNRRCSNSEYSITAMELK